MPSIPQSEPSTSHPERTAAQPRQSSLHTATICYTRLVNPRIRLLRLALPYAVKFLPGQWLDVHIPSLPQHTGGFTITSAPYDSSTISAPPDSDTSLKRSNHHPPTSLTPRPFFELAIQSSPSNPPAAWLWRDEKEILGERVDVRVGGSFTWPPPTSASLGKGDSEAKIRRAMFVAGGVGINPMISILSHLSQPAQLAHLPRTIRLLYGARIEAGETVDSVLFLLRLRRIFAAWNESRAASSSHNFSESKEGKKRLDLFLTGPGVSPSGEISKELTLDDVDVAHSSTSSTRRETEHAQEHNLWLHLHSRRMTEADLLEALGPVQDRNHEDTKETEEEGAADAYVCGPAAMTDQVVALLEAQGGMQGRVFCEKWW